MKRFLLILLLMVGCSVFAAEIPMLDQLRQQMNTMMVEIEKSDADSVKTFLQTYAHPDDLSAMSKRKSLDEMAVRFSGKPRATLRQYLQEAVTMEPVYTEADGVYAYKVTDANRVRTMRFVYNKEKNIFYLYNK